MGFRIVVGSAWKRREENDVGLAVVVKVGGVTGCGSLGDDVTAFISHSRVEREMSSRSWPVLRAAPKSFSKVHEA